MGVLRGRQRIASRCPDKAVLQIWCSKDGRARSRGYDSRYDFRGDFRGGFRGGARSDPCGLRRSASASFARPRDQRDPQEQRRKYDSASSLYGTPERFVGSFQKADAMLESRLTERLREQSFSSIDTRRPAARALGGGPGPERRSPWTEGARSHPGSQIYGFASTPGSRRPLVSATSSPYLPSSYSVAGDDVERLKMYSDLFEEVIERDRVFGSLLRKVKSAYDSMLQSKAMAPMPSVPPMPAPDTGPGSLGRYSESTREGPETWELYQENRALKDLVERLHMELEQAVKREQRWRSKASKLKGKVSDLYGTPAGWEQRGSMTGYPPEAWAFEAMPERRPSFQASRREPGVEAYDAALNQGGFFSLSSISPQSQLHPQEPDAGHGHVHLHSARSDESGILPQRPDRRIVRRPASVPKLDLAKTQQLEEEEYEARRDDDQYADQDGGYLVQDDGSDGDRPPSER
ncbi:unnamed protein product [Effrenium voratum]|uniref:Uncharacterized protein n=1 Tax=Effrenium voratum TaxID=2562239 RepID=A0AA36J186_9DINO|nr:unnamed protein product [Effrenium voratum]